MGSLDYKYIKEQELAELNNNLHAANDLVIERQGKQALDLLFWYSTDEILEGADNTGGACSELIEFMGLVQKFGRVHAIKKLPEMLAELVAKELDRSTPKSNKLVRDELNGGL